MVSSSQIRKQFIDYFVERCGHTHVPSSPVVPHDDPTLLFTNAGMNQFKDVFLGVGTRPYRRAVDTQKCIRAGGKHNDLEDVGKDTYHHTFFEMLGNWSFGDYFKREAIHWAWELLTDVWGLQKDRLHATVFEGQPAHGVERDDEAATLWREVTDINPEHIHFFGAKDNFWEMGDTGPCGPCSEIHIDLTPDKSGAALVNAGDARVMEIWNLVFIQFNRAADGQLTPLPAKHVDTGMGFERLCALLQNKGSNYDTDVFSPIFAAIADVTGAAPYAGELHKPEDVAYRVIADHIRTLTFAMTDGALPSNEGRGYVLRRILRRAVRYGRQTLGVQEPFFYRLVPAVVEPLSDAFPELSHSPGQVADVIREEEELFGKTLDRGIEHFGQAAKRGGKQISGPDAFELYATYGFPLDLTELMAQERGMSVDVAGFDTEMQRHQEISRGQAGQAQARESLVTIVQQSAIPETTFIGYERTALADGQVLALCQLDELGLYRLVNSVSAGQSVALAAQATPFYAEAGGQIGDTGTIVTDEGAQLRVEDTIKVGDIHFHLGTVIAGSFQDGQAIRLEVDEARRDRIKIHHTSTHMMNRALREVLGNHVQQRGSLVDDEKTRFDLSHPKAITGDEVMQIEQLVNEEITRDLAVEAAAAPQEEALQIHGLRAVFGEKYPPRVRVVSIGPSVDELLAAPENQGWQDYAIEFCGGTHLARTSQAEDFVVVGEEAVAKGIRRITAVAGTAATQARANGAALEQRIDKLASQPPEVMEKRLPELLETLAGQLLPLVVKGRLQARLSQLQTQVKEHHKTQNKQVAGQVVDVARRIAEESGGPVIVAQIDGADAKGLLSAVDVLRAKHPDSAVLLGSAAGSKVAFVASVPAPLIRKGLKAGDWVREVAKCTGGGGGGRPEMAQAGGKDPAKLPQALQTARVFADEKLG